MEGKVQVSQAWLTGRHAAQVEHKECHNYQIICSGDGERLRQGQGGRHACQDYGPDGGGYQGIEGDG